MSINFTEGFYLPKTIKIDRQGCLHMWEGSFIVSSHPTLPLADTRESEAFYQSQGDIDVIMQCLTDEQRGYLNKGYAICVKNIPDDYLFNQE